MQSAFRNIVILVGDAPHILITQIARYTFAGTSERWYWNSSSDQLFSEMIKMFVKLKVQSSGFPEGVTTQVEKEVFAAEMGEMLNTNLSINDFHYNSGLRLVAKVSINSVSCTLPPSTSSSSSSSSSS